VLAGKVYHQPIIALDIVPTALAAARCRLPADATIDGVNLLPYLTGRNLLRKAVSGLLSVSFGFWISVS
jgi:hypothetical protein